MLLTVIKLFGSFALIVAYSVLFVLVYQGFLYPIYGYFGFRNSGGSIDDFVIPVASIFLILFFLPGAIRSVSHFIIWNIYILMFIPIQLTLAMSGTVPGGATWTSAALLVSFLTLIMLSKLQFMFFPVYFGRLVTNYALQIIYLAGLIIAGALILRFHSIMSLAGVEEIYEQRQAAADSGAARLFSYLISWITYAIFPLLASAALFFSKRHLLFVSTFLLLVIYSITAAKLVIFLFGMTLFAYWVLAPGRRNYPQIICLYPILVLLIGYTVYLAIADPDESLVFYAVSQFVMRGLGVQAMIFNAYLEFFSVNPFTNFSHVTGLSLFLDYPYNDVLGRIISIHLVGHPNANANSGFWAMDGLAGAGNLGLIVMGVVVGIVLAFFDGVTRGVDVRFSGVAFCGILLMLSNVSIFTTLVTGGAVLLAIAVRPVYRSMMNGR